MVPLLTLKFAILKAGMHQYMVAARAGIAETRLSRIVQGREPAPPDVRKRLAAVLGVTEAELFGANPESRAHDMIAGSDVGDAA